MLKYSKETGEQTTAISVRIQTSDWDEFSELVDKVNPFGSSISNNLKVLYGLSVATNWLKNQKTRNQMK